MKVIYVMTLLITLVGCETMMKQHQQNMAALCTYDGAYSRGVSDAQNGTGSNASETLSSCDPQVMGKAMKGYNEGFASLSKQEEQESSTLGSLFGKILDTKIKNKSKSDSGLYECKIDVFTDTYTDKGKTTAEAIYNTKSKCTVSRGDDFFCKSNSKYKCKKLY